MYRPVFSFVLVGVGLLFCNAAEATQPFYVHSNHAYRPVVVGQAATSPTAVVRVAAPRQAIQQMPLLMRPNRVGHFYGNTVRRLHYTGRLLPRLR